MKNIFFSLLIPGLALALRGSAQQTFENYTRLDGQLRYGDAHDAVIPYGSRGYTLILPGTPGAGRSTDAPSAVAGEENRAGHPTNALAGTVIMLDDDRPNLQDTTRKQNVLIAREANAKGFAVLYISTGVPVDLYFDPHSLRVVDTLMRDVFERYRLPNRNIFFLGAMVSGHRALKYIEYCKKGGSVFNTQMKKPPFFAGLSIRAYTYADTRYWFSAQGRGIYDCNYPDMSGFINEQKLAGNKTAELIVFHSEATDPLKKEPRPQPSTWELVDKTELMDWVAKQGK